MTYAAVRDTVVAAASVSTGNDALVLGAVNRAAKYLLRNYNFPESLTYTALPTATSLGEGDTTVTLPSGVGKLKGVRLKQTNVDPVTYMVLHRREETVLPTEGGPIYYKRLATTLELDTELDDETYKIELWYQTVLLATAETWLTDTYEDVLFHLAMLRAAPILHKPELIQTYAPLWQQDEKVLAVYLNELEWEGMHLRMGSDEITTLAERYPAN